MKKQFLLLPLLLLIPSLSAKIITVDNNPGSVAMYSTAAAAIAAADPGDTLLFAGSATTYGGAHVIYKQLHFVGPGYFLGTNNIPGLNSNQAIIILDFKNSASLGDSSGSTCLGMSGKFDSDANVSGIVLDKCSNDGPSYGWTFGGQVTITRSFQKGGNVILNGSNCSIENSIISNLYLRATNITVDHCVIRNLIEGIDTNTISNTIFISMTSFDITGPSFSYCLEIGGTTLPEGTGNVDGLLLSNVLLATGSPDSDAYYRIKEGGPADGMGFGASDIGAFGGSNPYVLSGVPGIPRLTRLNVPASATGLTALTFELEAEAFPE